jgi:hypothetical protein
MAGRRTPLAMNAIDPDTVDAEPPSSTGREAAGTSGEAREAGRRAIAGAWAAARGGTGEAGWPHLMDRWYWVTIALSGIVALGSLIVIATILTPSEAETPLCDKAVSTVLSSTDPVELQRAGIVIRNLCCGIRLRLDDTGAFKPRAK